MKPIKNVCPASQGSEKGYSVNRSESNLMLVGPKRDEDSYDSSYVRHLYFQSLSTSFQRQRL